MLRTLLIASLAFSMDAARADDLWAGLEPYRLHRFEVSLPAGPGWVLNQGDGWFNVSRRHVSEWSDRYVWVGFEAGTYPENRYDWLASEISREIRDVQALRLSNEIATTGLALERIDYGESEQAGGIGYWMTWARPVRLQGLPSPVREVQELHVFLAPDHARDRSFMSLFFGVLCLTPCADDPPATTILAPILSSVTLGAADR